MPPDVQALILGRPDPNHVALHKVLVRGRGYPDVWVPDVPGIFSLRSRRSSSVNFFDFSQGNLENLVGNLEGIFRGFFLTHRTKAQKFRGKLRSIFRKKLRGSKKTFRAKFTLQTWHLKGISCPKTLCLGFFFSVLRGLRSISSDGKTWGCSAGGPQGVWSPFLDILFHHFFSPASLPLRSATGKSRKRKEKAFFIRGQKNRPRKKKTNSWERRFQELFGPMFPWFCLFSLSFQWEEVQKFPGTLFLGTFFSYFRWFFSLW